MSLRSQAFLLLLCFSTISAESFGSEERVDRAIVEDGIDFGDGGVEPVYTPIATPRGVRPHVPFQVGEIDSVDTGSGNLTVRIPLGQSYEVGPKLRYRFQLVHNSNAWDFVRATWVPNTEERTLGLPNPGSNAGLGWELHFGKLFAPIGKHPTGLGTSDLPRWPNRDGDPTDAPSRWIYVAPDGARYPLLRLPGRDLGNFERPIRYSKDGTMIRMRQTDDSTILVEMPDGLISEFQKTGATSLGTDFCRAGVSGCWRLAEIRDLYGNRLAREPPGLKPRSIFHSPQGASDILGGLRFRDSDAYRSIPIFLLRTHPAGGLYTSILVSHLQKSASLGDAGV